MHIDIISCEFIVIPACQESFFRKYAGQTGMTDFRAMRKIYDIMFALKIKLPSIIYNISDNRYLFQTRSGT
jgi:hypothetical protein